MTNDNNGTLKGKLVKDCELLTKDDGSVFGLSFTICWNESKREGDDWKQIPHFFNCAFLSKNSQKFTSLLKKGSLVRVFYSLRQNRWKQDEQVRSAVRLFVSSVELVNAVKTEGTKADVVIVSDSSDEEGEE